MSSNILVFDMDGVLVDVSESYRETISRTVHRFTGKAVTPERIQEYKNRGGFNNDFLLSQTICHDFGVDVPYPTVVDYFNEIFYGGLMQQERWMPNDLLLKNLTERYRLSIFTGRVREEALITLRRFACDHLFDPLIADEDVQSGKPAPDGLFHIRRRHPGSQLIYIGDTVDDARSARAANVPFIGVAARNVAHRARLLDLFEQEKAYAVIEEINELPKVLPE